MALDRRPPRVRGPSRYSARGPALVLKPRHGRLRGQRLAVHGMPIEQQLLDRIVGEPIAIVRIGMATGETEDSLRHQILAACARTSPGCRVVDEAAGQADESARSARPPPEQHRAAIRARMGLVERRDEGLGDEIGKENSLCYRVVVQRQRLRVEKGSFSNGFLPSEAFLLYSNHTSS